MIVVCMPGLDQATWHRVGKETCGTLAQCNVWIWNDADKAPEKAPEKDTDLTKEQVRDAVAVWINDTGQMMLLHRVK